MSRQPSRGDNQDQPHSEQPQPKTYTTIQRAGFYFSQFKFTRFLRILGMGAIVIVLAIFLSQYTKSPQDNPKAGIGTTGPAIPGNGGGGGNAFNAGLTQQAAAGVSSGSDPYAALSREQVMDAFVEAYKAKDWAKCNALISPMVKTGWHSPDELALQVAKQEQENGQLEVLGVGIVPDSDTGSQATFVVQYIRHLPTNQPTITPGRSLGGGTVDPTYQATVQARYNQRHSATYTANIEIRREGNAYKIFAYTIF